jgi:hypothetical protein
VLFRSQGGVIYPVLFTLRVNDIPTPSRHVKKAVEADDTAIIATFRQPALLVSYLESSQQPRVMAERTEDRQQRLIVHRDATSLRPVGASLNPAQFSYPGSQSIGLIPPVI